MHKNSNNKYNNNVEILYRRSCKILLIIYCLLVISYVGGNFIEIFIKSKGYSYLLAVFLLYPA